MNAFDEMRSGMAEARARIRAADKAAAEMGCLLVGRLRMVEPGTLQRLKKELTLFDARDGRWREEK